MKTTLIFLVAVTMLASCAVEKTIPSKVNVKEVSSLSNASTNSLVYSLPSTKVRINVTVEKTISKVGPFYRYSQKMLNVTDVITEDKVEWKIKDINISTYGVPDDSKRYVITYSGPSVAPFLNLSDDGILYGINNPQELRNDEMLVKNDYNSLPGIEDLNFNSVPTLEKQLMKTSTAAMAEEAANFIYKLRKRRFKILASDYENLPKDGQSYQVVVDELNKLEAEYLELFMGKKESYTISKSFDIHPNDMSANNDVLFRFSTVKGIVDKMDVSGAPVYIDITATEQAKLPDAPLPVVKEEFRTGLYYCRPGKVTIKLIDRNELIKEQEVYLGQYGQVLSLPSSVLEADNVSIKLDRKTGALKSIERK